MITHRCAVILSTFLLDSFVFRKYKGCEPVGRASKKTHMAMIETKVWRINILNEEKMMRVACV